MLNPIDYFLNRITMYRLLLYYLIGLTLVALILSFFHLLPFSPISFLLTVVFFVISCFIANMVFAYIFNVQTNFESVYISALILSLIVSPPIITTTTILNLSWIAGWTIASKFLFTINRKHIFNPVAFGVWFTGLVINVYATWWIGTGIMLPFVLIGGILLVRKIQREDMVISFILSALVTTIFFTVINNNNLFTTLQQMVIDTPLFFLAFVMLTEPLTSPPTKKLQSIYGIIVGFFFSSQLHLGPSFTTPEFAILVGNIFSYIVSPKTKLFLTIQDKIQASASVFDFVFTTPKFAFKPGQYMEWTLGHNHPDARGNRRYFTLASSPTEDTVRIGVRFYDNPSTFKQALSRLNKNHTIVASQIAGDFTMPEDKSKKLVFVAGGIGVTPYRSMIKYLLDTGERRDIVVLYSASTPSDFAYTDVFADASKKLGIKTIYTITDKNQSYPNWTGYRGRITPEIIEKEIPDYNDRIFYLSGPHEMVNGFEKTLKEMGINSKQIKKDFFRGLV